MKSWIVYSTEHGRICPECCRPVAECVCRQKEPAPKHDAKRDGIVRVSRETKGRKGKGMTLDESCASRSDALKKEHAVKTLSRKEKITIIGQKKKKGRLLFMGPPGVTLSVGVKI